MRTLILSLFILSIAAPASADECSGEAIQSVHERAGPALVEVEGPTLRFGMGVLVQGRRLVITSFEAVAAGRGIEVDHAGETIGVARIVTDERHRLALLELERPLSARPLQVSHHSLETGAPVIAVDRIHEQGVPRAEARPGVVTNDDGGLRTDALRWTPRGAPILDCEGRLVGLADGGERFLGAEPIADLLTEREMTPPYTGEWSLLHPSLTFPVQVGHGLLPNGERDVHIGVGIGTALIGHDRWFMPLRFSVLGNPRTKEERETDFDDEWKRKSLRFQVEAALGYRLMLGGGTFATYLVPKIGLAGGWQRVRLERERMEIRRGDCSTSRPCVASPVEERIETSGFYALPTVGLGLQTGPFELDYQLLVDPDRVSGSVHQLGLGIQF